MEAAQIKSADILDIIFDGRNETYGAYCLRKNYNSRLTISLVVMISIVLIAAVLLSFPGRNKPLFVAPFIPDPTLVDLSKPVQPIPKVITRPAIAAPKSENIKPIIVADNAVPKPPPTVEEFTGINIDPKSIEGDVVTGINAPIAINGSSILEVPVIKNNDNSTVYIDVQIPAAFKGDWNSYVKKQIENSSDELVSAGESGTCMVQFIVSTDGTVSNVEALTMKGSKLAEIAVTAISKGPKWKPAQNNGHMVKAYREQPVTSKIEE